MTLAADRPSLGPGPSEPGIQPHAPISGFQIRAEEARPGMRDGASDPEDVVSFEGLIDLGEPFGSVGRAAAAAFVER